jgi:hypothetical protein
MKFSSPVLFVAFLFGVALAEEAGSAHQMVAPLVKRGPTDQEQADNEAIFEELYTTDEEIYTTDAATSTEAVGGAEYPKQDSGIPGQKVTFGSMIAGLFALLFF